MTIPQDATPVDTDDEPYTEPDEPEPAKTDVPSQHEPEDD